MRGALPKWRRRTASRCERVKRMGRGATDVDHGGCADRPAPETPLPSLWPYPGQQEKPGDWAEVHSVSEMRGMVREER